MWDRDSLKVFPYVLTYTGLNYKQQNIGIKEKRFPFYNLLDIELIALILSLSNNRQSFRKYLEDKQYKVHALWRGLFMLIDKYEVLLGG